MTPPHFEHERPGQLSLESQKEITVLCITARPPPAMTVISNAGISARIPVFLCIFVIAEAYKTVTVISNAVIQ